MSLLDLLQGKTLLEGAIVAAALGGALYGLHHYGSTRYTAGQAEVQGRWDAQTLQRTAEAFRASERTAALEQTHAATIQGASDAFTSSQSARDTAVRADADRTRRLLDASEARAAAYRADATAGAAACLRLGDLAETLDRQLVEGIGVVAALRSDLERRDAEVVLLRGVIDADRALLTEDAPLPPQR